MGFTAQIRASKTPELQALFSEPQARRVLIKEIEHWAETDLDAQTQEVLAGKVLHRRTGHLASSTRWKVRPSKKSVLLDLKSGVPYANIHEYGGTIRPKRKKFLTVPLPAAQTPAGVTKPLKGFKNTFIIRSRSGGLLIVQDTGDGGIIPLFVLKKKVKIPARKWASKAVAKAWGKLYKRILRLSNEL